MKQKENLIGRKVQINAGWAKGEWGIIKGIINDEYHVAPWNTEDMALVFSRDEIIIKRK